ncbi:callose synthase 7 isoform X1 [Lactuca sativa]|uniref:callose synthase 7 isoform X1 n=1 Tax=Lactuca sativa TaxID=4236 RepID=UPI000CD8198F|nr:callose synthase 7 isoform X1 [Lactuca sativa]
MASTSGTKDELGPPRSLSRRTTRISAMDEPDDADVIVDSELVPSSLASIAPILRVANEIEKDNDRVAYLCRFHAYEKAYRMDPKSSGRGVRQFMTYLLHRLEKEEETTKPRLAKYDLREIQKFYLNFYEKNIREGQYTKKPAEMAKIYQTAVVLYDVLRTVVPSSKVEPEIRQYAGNVEENINLYEHYNILPMYAIGNKPEIMRIPEIQAAVRAIRIVDNLPSIRRVGDREKPIADILEWLSSIFGFQKGNVANQREHLVLLLANIDTRSKGVEDYDQLDSQTVKHLLDKTLKNYVSWCHYLHCTSIIDSLKCPPSGDRQQLYLLYIGLYLLVWGEASNVRFMPECLCYIFHNMANEMHGILFGNVQPINGGTYQVVAVDEEAFLREVISPIYDVLRKEAMRNKGGNASHASWRNYDDLNEYFWSNKCFKLGWPMNRKSDFFIHSDESSRHHVGPNQVVSGKKKSKTNFVEVRSFLHLYRSFDRMWIFLILVLQAMIIVAWHGDGSIFGILDEALLKNISSIFITYAILNFIQVSLDIILSFNAWRSLKPTQIHRYIFKFVVAAFWMVILSVGYLRSVPNPTGFVKFLSTLGGNWRGQLLYNYLVAIYLIPNILAAFLYLLPPIRRHMESSNWRIVTLIMWWAQPKLYVGRGMHEGIFSLFKYTLFWIVLLISKFAFSYYVEILPLVKPTKLIMKMHVSSHEWHEFFPNMTHNIGVVICIWGPTIMVYFMDTQIWYTIYATIIGGIYGVFRHLGEIRTLGMLRSRFESVPLAFVERLVPMQKDPKRDHVEDDLSVRKNIAKFSQVWNEFILSMRMEDLISNSERDLLLVPYTTSDVPVVQWPLFMLASKIPIALDMAKDFKGKEDADLFRKISSDDYMQSAVIECYQTLKEILFNLFDDERDKKILQNICHEIETSIHQGTFLNKFYMSELPLLNDKLERLLDRLLEDNVGEAKHTAQIVNVCQDIMEIITKDVMKYEHEILEKPRAHHRDNDRKERFEQINVGLTQMKSWKEKVMRLRLLLTVKESAFDVPTNLEARRRITFFVNSLYIRMPNAPIVRNMLSFSVLTPYYKEDVLYSKEELHKENEDGISVLFYLQKIYPDEWNNFEERINGIYRGDKTEAIRQWASYRGQTLSRTVRGMMYYKEALELQCFLDYAKDVEIFTGFRTFNMNKHHMDFKERATAMADLKFTYVISCQIYGAQKKSSDERDQSCYTNILKLMLTYPSLRVAYIDEREATINGRSQNVYYSVLVKGEGTLDQEIYRIKLPGHPSQIGEGRPENQNHAIIFTRGEALQTIDMNQDNYFEEAFKMRNVLEEFKFHKDRHGQHRPTILGLREHIFTGSVSSLAWFNSNQQTSFVTIGQRILADPLRVRFHYGHPDIFDRIFHITRGGISKASRTINLSDDIFSGYNSTLRGGYATHHEYIQVGKGRDVGMNQISLFEAKVANGNGEQTLSRDVYRLGRRFDFLRMLSFYYTTVGFYFSSMVTVLIVYAFLYGHIYMVLSGLEGQILEDESLSGNKVLEEALVIQSVFQLGLLLMLPIVMEISLERGFRTALRDFIIMQLQLASVFFTFQLGTKAHYYGRTILHGGSKYRATGRGLVVFHAKFADNYRLYSRSHFVKGLELAILLIIYQAYGNSYRSSNLYLFITFSIWFLVASWLLAPFVFNPLGIDWQKTVEDWTDWKRWIGNRGGIGISQDKSWESWWDAEQQHLKYTNIRGRILEIILACRFFIYQYGLVYRLNIAGGSTSILVYAFSWLVLISALLEFKLVSMAKRFGTNLQLMFRILKAFLFLVFLSLMTVLFIVCGLTISDIFVAFLAFVPTGWAIILIGQACRPCVKCIGFWDSIMELGRAYECLMGLVIFMPIVILSWFPFVSEFQTKLLFNQALRRGLQISMILAGKKDKDKTQPT